jgi:hypothetical protein
MKRERPETVNINLSAVFQGNVFWQPTSLIRWKRVEIDKLRYEKVLQQLWKGDRGEEEWRDVPEED